MDRLGLLVKSAVGVAIVLALVSLGGDVNAFSQYSFVKNDNFPPPDAPQYNGCRTCHGDFNGVDTEMSGQTWPSNLMDTHVDFMVGNSDCSTCHSPGPRFPVQLGSSAGGELLEPISCAGCHGREEDGTPDPGDGAAGYGLGLRRHHWNANVTVDLDPDPVGELLITTRVCADCHTDADPAGGAVPVAESVKPPYYADPDGGAPFHPPMPRDPCNDPSNMDTPEEEKVGDLLALDNDGDLAYDLADSDCSGVFSSPGETAGPALDPLRVTGHDLQAPPTISLSYGMACSATDNTIVYGPLNQVSTYAYSGEACGLLNSGVFDWDYPAVPESFFFLVVANDGSREGSYGNNSDAEERPPHSGNLLCPLPQDILNRCD